MPPKKKASTKSRKRKEEITQAPEPNTDIIQETTHESSTIADESIQPSDEGSSKPSVTMSDRLRSFEKLKKRKQTEVAEGNRQDRNEEFQRSKINPREEARLERKKQEALELLARKEAEERGEDYERKRYWEYSAEDVERWEEKQATKASRANIGFTDFNQMSYKKYQRLISELKPDVAGYNEKKAEAVAKALNNGENLDEILFFGDANAIEIGNEGIADKPSKEALDRLVADVHKQIERRENRNRKRERDPQDITWINEANRAYNEKIARFYDKYTKEIRENFERGTAL